MKKSIVKNVKHKKTRIRLYNGIGVCKSLVTELYNEGNFCKQASITCPVEN
jgi:hypothetical protein